MDAFASLLSLMVLSSHCDYHLVFAKCQGTQIPLKLKLYKIYTCILKVSKYKITYSKSVYYNIYKKQAYKLLAKLKLRVSYTITIIFKLGNHYSFL